MITMQRYDNKAKGENGNGKSLKAAFGEAFRTDPFD